VRDKNNKPPGDIFLGGLFLKINPNGGKIVHGFNI
jgi:hypothetical protein